MRLLVTGGMGFIGSNFIRYTLERYDDVSIVNLDALKYGSNPDNLKTFEGDERYSFVRGDICDFETIAKLVAKTDVIINFAAETHVDRSISNPESFIYSNFVGVFKILEAIRKKNSEAKLIQISTDEVYGDISNGSFKEEDRLKPSSPYSATKASADLLILSYMRTYKIKATIIRCTNNYGPYQFPEKLIPKTIIRAYFGLKVPIYGSGKNVRDWIFVIDHCRAIETILQKGEFGIYNVASGEEKTNLEVVETILKLMGKDDSLVEFVEDRPGHDIRYSLDSTKIRDIGWRPIFRFKEGIKRTVEWYLGNEDWWKKLLDEKIIHPTPWRLEW
ncbi:MAG: dTDP-glucose 4,6-dehydratase [Candidatus Micrarchaeota archaeon]|nr:dTDP-glucose 4,6-dehydratase [Candidatus Micrarchaeota archaeon]